jgi:hypothetical protein
VEQCNGTFQTALENIKSSMASTKREPALPSLLEKLRKRMVSTATTKRTPISGERSAPLRAWIVWVIPVVEPLTEFCKDELSE